MQNCKCILRCTESARQDQSIRIEYLCIFFQDRRQDDQSINIAMCRMVDLDSALHLVLPPSEVRNPLRQPVYQRTDSPLFIFRQSDGEDQNPIHTFFTCFCQRRIALVDFCAGFEQDPACVCPLLHSVVFMVHGPWWMHHT